MPERDETPAAVHPTDQDLNRDPGWLNLLAQYDEAVRRVNLAVCTDHDQELIARVDTHLEKCAVCRNVVATWHRVK